MTCVSTTYTLHTHTAVHIIHTNARIHMHLCTPHHCSNNPAVVTIFHHFLDRAQRPTQSPCVGGRELTFTEHLPCATHHTCASPLKLSTNLLKFILKIVNLSPRDMTPIMQRVGCQPGMVPLHSVGLPSPHPHFSAEEK